MVRSQQILMSDQLKEEDWQLIEENRLQDREEYQKWRKETWKHYQQVVESTPSFNVRPYQPDFAALYCCRHRNIIGLSLGGGKTLISALAIASIYDLSYKRAGRIHIAVPNSLCAGRWLEDLYLVPSLRSHFEYINSSKRLRKSKSPIIIYNQDLPRQTPKGYKQNVKFMKKHLRPSLLIIDEVHNLKPETQRTKTMEQLQRVSKRSLALTGTISDGDLSMVPHLCKFIYRDHFPYTVKEFSKRFGVKHKISSTYKSGSTGEEESNNRYLKHLDVYTLPEYFDLMSRFCHRVTLDDSQVKPYVKRPSLKKKSIEVEPSKEQIKSHKAFIRKRHKSLQEMSEAGQDEETVLTVLHPLIRVANSQEESPKLEATKKQIESTEDKVVIFSTWNDSSRLLNNYLHRNGIKTSRVYAHDEETVPKKMGEEMRGRTIYQFLHDDSIKCCILQVNLASESIDLQNAGMIIFYDLPWSSLKVEQAIARVVRPGNPREEVEVVFPYNKGLIDDHQLNLIQSKMKLSSLLFDYDVESSTDTKVSALDIINEMLEDQ